MLNLMKIAKAQMIQMEVLNEHYSRGFRQFFEYGVPVIHGRWNRWCKAKAMENKTMIAAAPTDTEGK